MTRAMAPEALGALGVELLALHAQIFDGVSPAAFRAFVLSPDAERNLVLVQRDASGEPVGYACTHTRRVRVGGRVVIAVRAAMGVLPEHRGGALQEGLAREFVRNRLRWPFSRMVWVGTPIGPDAYVSISRTLGEYWPRPDAPTPAAALREMLATADALGLDRVDPEDPLLCACGWRVREDTAQLAERSPVARWYVARNPRYVEGVGLLFWAPYSTSNILYGLRRTARTLWRRLT